MFGNETTKKYISCLIENHKYTQYVHDANSSATMTAESIRAKRTSHHSLVHADDALMIIFRLCEKVKATNTYGVCYLGDRPRPSEHTKTNVSYSHTEAIKWCAKRWVRIKNKRRKIILMFCCDRLRVVCARCSSPQLFSTRFYRRLWYDARQFVFVWFLLRRTVHTQTHPKHQFENRVLVVVIDLWLCVRRTHRRTLVVCLVKRKKYVFIQSYSLRQIIWFASDFLSSSAPCASSFTRNHLRDYEWLQVGNFVGLKRSPSNISIRFDFWYIVKTICHLNLLDWRRKWEPNSLSRKAKVIWNMNCCRNYRRTLLGGLNWSCDELDPHDWSASHSGRLLRDAGWLAVFDT